MASSLPRGCFSAGGGYSLHRVLSTETHEFAGSVWVVDADGELDLATAGQLSRLLDEVAGRNPSFVAVDLTDLSFIDSSGARALVRAKKRLEAIGARLAILRPHAMPRSFLRRTNLDRLIAIAETVEEAVERSARLQMSRGSGIGTGGRTASLPFSGRGATPPGTRA